MSITLSPNGDDRIETQNQFPSEGILDDNDLQQFLHSSDHQNTSQHQTPNDQEDDDGIGLPTFDNSESQSEQLTTNQNSETLDNRNSEMLNNQQQDEYQQSPNDDLLDEINKDVFGEENLPENADQPQNIDDEHGWINNDENDNANYQIQNNEEEDQITSKKIEIDDQIPNDSNKEDEQINDYNEYQNDINNDEFQDQTNEQDPNDQINSQKDTIDDQNPNDSNIEDNQINDFNENHNEVDSNDELQDQTNENDNSPSTKPRKTAKESKDNTKKRSQKVDYQNFYERNEDCARRHFEPKKMSKKKNKKQLEQTVQFPPPPERDETPPPPIKCSKASNKLYKRGVKPAQVPPKIAPIPSIIHKSSSQLAIEKFERIIGQIVDDKSELSNVRVKYILRKFYIRNPKMISKILKTLSSNDDDNEETQIENKTENQEIKPTEEETKNEEPIISTEEANNEIVPTEEETKNEEQEIISTEEANIEIVPTEEETKNEEQEIISEEAINSENPEIIPTEEETNNQPKEKKQTTPKKTKNTQKSTKKKQEETNKKSKTQQKGISKPMKTANQYKTTTPKKKKEEEEEEEDEPEDPNQTYSSDALKKLLRKAIDTPNKNDSKLIKDIRPIIKGAMADMKQPYSSPLTQKQRKQTNFDETIKIVKPKKTMIKEKGNDETDQTSPESPKSGSPRSRQNNSPRSTKSGSPRSSQKNSPKSTPSKSKTPYTPQSSKPSSPEPKNDDFSSTSPQ